MSKGYSTSLSPINHVPSMAHPRSQHEGALMLPPEYQIDDDTARRMEEEAGQPLPDGAVEALHELETELPTLMKAVRRRMQPGPETVWSLAMMLAQIGAAKYVQYWQDEIDREIRQMEEILGIPPATEYHIDGFHIENVGRQPVEVEGEVKIQNCWRFTDDGADEPFMSVFLDDDAPVEKILRKLAGWNRQIQAMDEDELP